jgi:FKBP-type peptidyl-prolyl cis-trans isomerase (trigger factor)
MNDSEHTAVVPATSGTQSITSPVAAPRHDAYMASFSITQTSSHLWHMNIIVPAASIDAVYHETVRLQQLTMTAPGFKKGTVPLEYIQENYLTTLVHHLKEFFLKFSVLNFLYSTIGAEKLPIAGEPRLETIDLTPHHDARFRFALDIIPNIDVQEWKYLPFKAPKRKNYKDLDRQVEHFVATEEQLYTSHNADFGIHIGDWVLFSLSPVNNHHLPLMGNHVEKFWFKMGCEEVDNPLRTLFLGKRQGDSVYISNRGLQQYLSNQLDIAYTFRVEILDTLPCTYLCLELLKRHFRIKTNKDMNKKLIEIFSYRNDLSQRRSMVESSLKLLMSKHMIEVPPAVILREQKQLLEVVQENPDYNVYRVQKDFTHRIRQLAEKQAREKIFIDSLAYKENIAVTNLDVKGYLNLGLRPRTKEFIYFRYEEPTLDGQEVPIPAHILKRTCLREKTINYSIFYLTKK